MQQKDAGSSSSYGSLTVCLQAKVKICSRSSYFSFISLERSTNLPIF